MWLLLPTPNCAMEVGLNHQQLALVSRSQTASSLHFLQTDVIGREEGSGDNPMRKLCSVHTFQDTCGMLI